MSLVALAMQKFIGRFSVRSRRGGESTLSRWRNQVSFWPEAASCGGRWKRLAFAETADADFRRIAD
jgi:hypothetical protein